MSKNFYKQIEEYYDSDADDFDARYWQNPVLQRIRQDFREEVKRFTFKNILEIGYGTGLDLVHFGKTHPEACISGIDISSGMMAESNRKIKNEKLENVSATIGSVEDIPGLFPNEQFDMIYVFFGALNTEEDLEKAAAILHKSTKPGGVLVLTFVNKFYMTGMVLEMMKFRFRKAFSRLKKIWGGYSPSQYLPSRCYSPKEIKEAFSRFILRKRKGYSIIHPAWYYHNLNRKIRPLSRWLWKADRLLNKTPLWSIGEYTLFVFQKPDDISQ